MLPKGSRSGLRSISLPAVNANAPAARQVVGTLCPIYLCPVVPMPLGLVTELRATRTSLAVLGWLMLLAMPTALAAQDAQPAAPVSLEPGDVLRVTIWREEDLSGEFTVDERGAVTLPMLGEQRVAGMPLSEMRDRLIAAYRVQLRNPSIEITPLRRIHVLGEVNKPDLYEVDPTISIAGVIALAGGATGSGDLNRIRVLRGGEVIRQRIAAESALATADVKSGDQIFVGQRSWFERNSTFVVSTVLSLTAVVIGLLQR